ncbi:MAG: hypothetical protein ABIR17_11760 [Pseudolysinimonas sp.]|uniref:hypothetical protein n=1 Tax=Pseudolysinimonas sp. TaxID=2680009 RepID=UPI003266CFD9
MTTDAIQIELSQLRAAFDAVMRHIESTSGSIFELRADYFWSVPNPDRYAVEDQPTLTIGQTSWSWENLQRERTGDDEETIGFAAVWIGEVLTAIGHAAVG